VAQALVVQSLVKERIHVGRDTLGAGDRGRGGEGGLRREHHGGGQCEDQKSPIRSHRPIVVHGLGRMMPRVTRQGISDVNNAKVRVGLLAYGATSTAPGYLVLTDTWFPGWRVRVDGRERPLLLRQRARLHPDGIRA
jgi:hypothetical protein